MEDVILNIEDKMHLVRVILLHIHIILRIPLNVINKSHYYASLAFILQWWAGTAISAKCLKKSENEVPV